MENYNYLENVTADSKRPAPCQLYIAKPRLADECSIATQAGKITRK